MSDSKFEYIDDVLLNVDKDKIKRDSYRRAFFVKKDKMTMKNDKRFVKMIKCIKT